MTHEMTDRQAAALLSEVTSRAHNYEVYKAKGEWAHAELEAGVIHGVMRTVGILYGAENPIYKKAESFWLRRHFPEPELAEVPQRDCPHFDMG